MKKFVKSSIITISLFIGFFLSGYLIAFADSNDFSIAPIFSENQREDVEGYFDMVVAPNATQSLAITIKNNSSDTQKYNVIINTATTNQNGIVDYSMTDFEKDDSMKISLREIINIEKSEIEVEANSQKNVSFELSIPEESFEGILLGGITVEPVIEEESEGISNLVTRTLAIVLSESDDVVEPELKAGEVDVSQDNYRNNVKFELRNVTATLINRITAEITIYKKGKSEPVIEQTKEQMSIAPNSKFNLMTEWNDQFDAGSYTYNITLSDEQGHEWEFTKEFKIEAEKAKELNTTSVDEKQDSLNYYLIISLALFFILIILCIYLVIKIKRLKKIQ